MMARLMEGMVYGVRVLDAPTFLLVPAILMLVALVASFIPARRAAAVDPLVALRSE